MPPFNSKAFQAFIDELITTKESEAHFSPLTIDLPSELLRESQDLIQLKEFLKEKRKRFFIFKLKDASTVCEELEFLARRSFLSHYADEQLKTPLTRLNPYKLALKERIMPRPAIQIQKEHQSPEVIHTVMAQQAAYHSPVRTPTLTNADLQALEVALESPKYKLLCDQLRSLRITQIHPEAALKIKTHFYAFTDGIMRKNLPSGFYIDEQNHALGWSETRPKMTSALVPRLEALPSMELPSCEEAINWLQNLTPADLVKALYAQESSIQKNALIAALDYARKLDSNPGTSGCKQPAYVSKLFDKNMSGEEKTHFIPFFVKFFILAGEAPVYLLAQLMNLCKTKKLALDFLFDPHTQNALLFCPQGLKNLQKLLSLPEPQRAWWNALTKAHLQNPAHIFDFNAFFKAFSQEFIVFMNEKKLPFSGSCPIEHPGGHFLITLNRVMDVIEHSVDPAEQIHHLKGLNWGPTGAHFAMHEAAKPIKFVTARMDLKDPADTTYLPAFIYPKLQEPHLYLNTWAWRYIGQHWNSKIKFAQLNALFQQIETSLINSVEQKTWFFIFTCTFENQQQPTSHELSSTLTKCLDYLLKLPSTDRQTLLSTLAKCYVFRPTLSQIQGIIENYLEIRAHFAAEQLAAYLNCLENESLVPFHRLEKTVQKLDSSSTQARRIREAKVAFADMLTKRRRDIRAILDPFYPDFINLLTSLDTATWEADQLDPILREITQLNQKNPSLCAAVLELLGQLNTSRSRILPKFEQISSLFKHFNTQVPSQVVNRGSASATSSSDSPTTTLWVKSQILEKDMLPGCTFGEGDLSDPGDLIINGLMEVGRKRAGLLNKVQLLPTCGLICFPDSFSLDNINKKTKLHEIKPRSLLDKINGLPKTCSTFIYQKDKLYYFNPFDESIAPLTIKPEHKTEYEALKSTLPPPNRYDSATPEQLKYITRVSYITYFKEAIIYQLNFKLLGMRVVSDDLKESISQGLFPVLDALGDFFYLIQTAHPSFEQLLDCLQVFENNKRNLVEAKYTTSVGSANGYDLISILLTGKIYKNRSQIILRSPTGEKVEEPTGLLRGALVKFYEANAKKLSGFFVNPKNNTIVNELTYQTLASWFEMFNQTHSLIFWLKEELVTHKIIPALKKTLKELDTQDPDFEEDMLKIASDLPESDQRVEHQRSGTAKILWDYKNTIHSIALYLSLLRKLKTEAPSVFVAVFQKMKLPSFKKLGFSLKEALVTAVLTYAPALLPRILDRLENALNEHHAIKDPHLWEQAVVDACKVFQNKKLNEDTQLHFFSLILRHTLRGGKQFPLEALVKLQALPIEAHISQLIMDQLSRIMLYGGTTSDPLIHLIELTFSFLNNSLRIHNAGAATKQELSPSPTHLCLSLLKHVKPNPLRESLAQYSEILKLLANLDPAHFQTVCRIMGLLSEKKDKFAHLAILMEITTKLVNRLEQLDLVNQLFTCPPYPPADTLNAILSSHGVEDLRHYCNHFDTNPFAKLDETRPLAVHFSTSRVHQCLLNLKDLTQDLPLSHDLQMTLARQLTYIETLGYTDPLNPNDFTGLKKLTLTSRSELTKVASNYLQQLRNKEIPASELERAELTLLAYLREIYFRTTGFFPYPTQMLTLLLSFHFPVSLLMQIKTGEGKSIITPMLAVLQWTHGGTVDVCTANRTLLERDYEKHYEAFFNFFKDEHDQLLIQSTQIHAHSEPTDYKLNGINCSTLEDLALFRLETQERPELIRHIVNDQPIHLVLDECDDALLDHPALFKLVSSHASKNEANNAWIYKFAYYFIREPAFTNVEIETAWDEDEDIEQFRLYLSKQLSEKNEDDPEKQAYLMKLSHPQLKQILNASCQASLLIENKHFVIQQQTCHQQIQPSSVKMVCVPLVRSIPKPGCVFIDGVQQAMQARMRIEQDNENFIIEADASVLASQSAHGFIQSYQKSNGRLIGVSGTPGDHTELQVLATQFGAQAISVPTHKKEHRTTHPAEFTFSFKDTVEVIHQTIEKIQRPLTKPVCELDPTNHLDTHKKQMVHIQHAQSSIQNWAKTQTQPILIVAEDFDDATKIGQSLQVYQQAGFTLQVLTGKETKPELEQIIDQAGLPNTITVGTASLGRGIDIDTRTHPKGLFVIQAYIDSERRTRQIQGRTARNGKPGESISIYQINKPTHPFMLFLYYFIGFFIPSYRKWVDEKAKRKIQHQLKQEANAERIYSHAVDRTQQILMHQIHAWESLILNIDPSSKDLLNTWRSSLFSELHKFQATQLDPKTLPKQIAQYQQAIGSLWKTQREDNWAARVLSKGPLSPEQQIRYHYLSKLNFEDELQVQTQFRTQTYQLKKSSEALAKQNLETVILNKAGAVLHYHPGTPNQNKLELAQHQQLLPSLVEQLSKAYPPAAVLKPKWLLQDSHDTSRLAGGIQGSNYSEGSHGRIEQGEEQEATSLQSEEQVLTLLTEMKPFILDYHRNLEQASLIEKFKAQGLFLQYLKLIKEVGIRDSSLETLQVSNETTIMSHLADYLMSQFAWVKEKSLGLHLLDRQVAIQAADELYEEASQVKRNPTDANLIQKLYQTLLKHHFKLRHTVLIPIGHAHPHQVIATALAAIDTLTHTPHLSCEKEFRNSEHDKALINHYLTKFKQLFASLKPKIHTQKERALWNRLHTTLLNISSQGTGIALVTELQEAIRRFLSYPNTFVFKETCKPLQKELDYILERVTAPSGLIDQSLTSFMQQKRSQFAKLFEIDDPNSIHIHSAHNGLNPYIEIQIQNQPKRNGFMGYQSPVHILRDLQESKRALKEKLDLLSEQGAQLLSLGDEILLNRLELPARTMRKLCEIKSSLIRPWETETESFFSFDEIQAHFTLFKKLQNSIWDENTSEDEVATLEKFLKGDPDLRDAQDLLARCKNSVRTLNTLERRAQAEAEQKRQVLPPPQESKFSLSGSLSSLFSVVSMYSTPHGSAAASSTPGEQISHEQKNLIAHREQLNQKKLGLMQKLETQAKACLHREGQQALFQFENTCRKSLATIEELEQKEQYKSRVQTGQFFGGVREVVNFAAELEKEKEAYLNL